MSIIAIDYGGRRIGVAVSDSGAIATPHSVVKNEGEIIDKLARIALELDAETIVVGIARRTKSESGNQKFHDFAERLRQKTCKRVVLWDEALSTFEAARQLRENGTKRRDAQREIDMHAAAVILQSYLDAQTLDGQARRPS
ncbi:MAG: putative pre6S rRNA nuclease [Thermoanaerobaculia bacterium]|jgi:putative Holliday junction resolvase|nr:putative pre6S rRNA nuclease [Thermoanaerobaculia bacterium]